MRDWLVSDKLKKILDKLAKKDRTRCDATLKKMDEVINSENPDHYKNLRYDLSVFKRTHIDSHFVLIFKIEKNLVKFEDLQHHDTIYRNK